MNPNECNQGLHNYLFFISLGRCDESCNATDEPSGKIWVPNKTDGVNLKVFKVITEINELETIINHISCKFISKFCIRKCNSN